MVSFWVPEVDNTDNPHGFGYPEEAVDGEAVCVMPQSRMWAAILRATSIFICFLLANSESDGAGGFLFSFFMVLFLEPNDAPLQIGYDGVIGLAQSVFVLQAVKPLLQVRDFFGCCHCAITPLLISKIWSHRSPTFFSRRSTSAMSAMMATATQLLGYCSHADLRRSICSVVILPPLF